MSLQQINTYGYELERVHASILLGVPDDTFAVPVALQTIPFFAIKNGDLWRWNTGTFIWEQITSGGAVTTIYTGDGLIADAVRTVSLNGNVVNFDSPLGTNLGIAEAQSYIAGRDAAGGGNTGIVTATTNALSGIVNIQALFDNVTKQAQIQLEALVSGSSINYTADSHVLAGLVTLSNLAGNGVGVVAVDNAGLLSFGAASGGGYSIVNVSSTPHNPAQTSGEHILLVDCTAAGGPVTINLPTAVGNTAKFTIKKIDSGSDIITIDGSGGQTIDGDLTKEIEFQWTAATIVSDNLNWLII